MISGSNTDYTHSRHSLLLSEPSGLDVLLKSPFPDPDPGIYCVGSPGGSLWSTLDYRAKPGNDDRFILPRGVFRCWFGCKVGVL